MRAVVQRVSHASVIVADEVIGEIQKGVLVYLGVGTEDSEADVSTLAQKIAGLRIFPDERGLMNLPLAEADGAALVIPAFTTQADTRRGRRPSYDGAAPPEQAQPLYESFCDTLAGLGVSVERGRFQADMMVSSTNAGPVCLLLDSKKVF